MKSAIVHAVFPKSRPNKLDSLDWVVLTFTLALSLLTSFLFGLAPAWRASQVDFHDKLKEGGRGGTQAASEGRLRDLLVVCEVALTLLLLTGAGLRAEVQRPLASVVLGGLFGSTLPTLFLLPVLNE